MNTKNHQIRIVIYIIIGAVIAAVGVFLVLHSNNSKSGISLQDKLDLGHKYLVELSYDKAVLEFTDAIEIDPMNADAYLGLADAYIGQGDTDKAVEVLEKGFDKTGDERIKEKLDELKPVEETTVTTVTTVSENIVEPIKNEYVYMYIPTESSGSNDFYLYYYNYKIGVFDLISSPQRIYYFLADRNGYNGAYILPTSLFEIRLPYEDKTDPIVSLDTSNCKIGIGKQYAGTSITENGSTDITYKYDKNGKCIEIIYSSPSNPDEIYRHIFFDSNENIIKEISLSDEQIYSYVYDNNGNVIEVIENDTFYIADGGVDYIDDYSYDLNGNCTKHVRKSTQYSLGNVYEDSQTNEYFYNDEKNIIKDIYYSNDDVVGQTMYEYDANGNLITKIYTSADGGLEHRTEYSYMRVKVLRSEVEKLKEDYGVELKVFEIE